MCIRDRFYYEGKNFEGEKISGIFEAETARLIEKDVYKRQIFMRQLYDLLTSSFSSSLLNFVIKSHL